MGGGTGLRPGTRWINGNGKVHGKINCKSGLPECWRGGVDMQDTP